MKDFIISDLDGTLLNKKAELSKFTISVIKSLNHNKIPFSIATARSWETTKEIASILEIEYPIILMNGVFIYDPKEKVMLKEELLSTQQYKIIYQCLLENKLNPFVYCFIKNQFKILYTQVTNKCEKNYISQRLEKGDQRFTKLKEIPQEIDGNIISTITMGKYDNLKKSYEQLKKIPNFTIHFTEDIYCPGYYWLEITSANASKGKAIHWIKTNYNKYSNFLGFGDNLNDLSLFNAVDLPIAPDNARVEVKNKAKIILAKDNNQDAIAHYLRAKYLD